MKLGAEQTLTGNEFCYNEASLWRSAGDAAGARSAWSIRAPEENDGSGGYCREEGLAQCLHRRQHEGREGMHETRHSEMKPRAVPRKAQAGHDHA